MEQNREKVGEDHVLATPLWMSIVRGVQIFVSLIILGLCASLIHDASLPEEGFALAMCVLSWIGIAYIVCSEKIRSARGAYHIIAVIIVDGLLMILWLAAFAACARLRASYVYDVNVTNCTSDGSLVDSKSCDIAKRELAKRNNVILFKKGLAMLSAIAGLGALMWLLFVACFVFTILGLVKGRKQGRFPLGSGNSTTANNNYQMENKIAESQPMSPQAYPSQTQPAPMPFQDAPQNQYQQPVQQPAPVQQQQFQQAPPAQYPPQGQVPYQQTQSPYQQQQSAYPPPQDQQNYGQYPPQQQQQQYQQPIQPQMTGQSQPAPAYGTEQYNTPPPVSPPPQQYQQQYPPQH